MISLLNLALNFPELTWSLCVSWVVTDVFQGLKPSIPDTVKGLGVTFSKTWIPNMVPINKVPRDLDRMEHCFSLDSSNIYIQTTL